MFLDSCRPMASPLAATTLEILRLRMMTFCFLFTRRPMPTRPVFSYQHPFEYTRLLITEKLTSAGVLPEQRLVAPDINPGIPRDGALENDNLRAITSQRTLQCRERRDSDSGTTNTTRSTAVLSSEPSARLFSGRSTLDKGPGRSNREQANEGGCEVSELHFQKPARRVDCREGRS